MSEYPLTARVDAEDWDGLFIDELGWSRSKRRPLTVEVGARELVVAEIAQFKGIGIWLCEKRPTEEVERYVEARISEVSTDHLVIFTDGTRQDWRWPRRRQLGAVNAKLLNHPWVIGGANQDRQAFEARLAAISLPWDEELLVTDVLARLRTAFDRETQTASSKAATLMGSLYEMVRPPASATEGERLTRERSATQLLARLLFLFFADDTGVWASNVGHPDEKRDLFLTWVRQETTPEDFTDRIGQLFDALAAADSPARTAHEDLDRFPVVAGAIFAESIELPALSGEFRRSVIEACADFDWSIVSPAIFGSMFQTVKDAKARREMGEHYTTEANIQKAIGPLFMDELREKLEDVDNLDTDRKKINALERLLAELADIRVMDPACGCGNFLVVSYRDLRALELEVLGRLQYLDLKRSQTSMFADDLIGVRLEHFTGIEIEEWPARIATTALYLTRHLANIQMQQVLGIAPQTLPLADNRSIHHANAIRLDWNEVVPPSGSLRIVGNPPFIGHKSKTPEQVADLKAVWGSGYDGYLDYVTGWFKKAADHLATATDGQFAFVATNSISQGQPVRPLFEPLLRAGWRIRFAHQTFAWSSEAPEMAHVHCVIIGFDRAPEGGAARILFTYPDPMANPAAKAVSHINGYLTEGPDILIGKRSRPLCPVLPGVNYGTMPVDGGNLLVNGDDYPRFAADAIAVKYLRRFVGAKELIHGATRWCVWTEDEDFDPADLDRSPLLKERVEACATWRSAQKPSGDAYKMRTSPHRMRPNKTRPRIAYVCIPRHFSERRRYAMVAHFGPETISGDANFTAVDPDGFLFGIISSSTFIAWQRAVGGTLESRLRFSKDVVWNNLPLPEVDDATRAQVAEAGRTVIAARELYHEQSLADLYDPQAMPSELLAAHQALDVVVDRAFGATEPLETNEQRLELLFKNYQEMTA